MYFQQNEVWSFSTLCQNKGKMKNKSDYFFLIIKKKMNFHNIFFEKSEFDFLSNVASNRIFNFQFSILQFPVNS